MLKRLAVGGMAELFLARDAKTDALIVIKRILPYLSEEAEFVQMFLDEARIASQFDHPNVVQVHELGKLSESIFIAMEFVDGVDLRKILQEEMKRNAVVPANIAAWVIARICDALHYAHNRKGLDGKPLEIIHRDVSPQNVMVAYDGGVKLVDFGIAKANSYMERSKPGVIKGKFLYLSPEQLSQNGVDHRADLFAVGTMLYEVTTGKSPFYKATTEAVILAIRGEDPPPPHLVARDYPMELSRIVMKCLTKDRSKRYQQGSEIAKDLDAWLRTYPVPTGAQRVADYVDGLFGNEGERTVLHIPAKTPAAAPVAAKAEPAFKSGSQPGYRKGDAARPPPAKDRVSGVMGRRDSEGTNPITQPPVRRDTADAPVPGAQFLDDEPRTQMAGPRELTEAFRATAGKGVSGPPARRPSGQDYPSAGAPSSDPEAEHTNTHTSNVSTGPTSSLTPPTRSEKPGNSFAQDEGPIFDDAEPLQDAGDGPRTVAEGSRASRVRPAKSGRSKQSLEQMAVDDPSVTGSDGAPLDEDEDYSTVAGAHRFGGISPVKIVIAAVAAAVLIIVTAAIIRAFSGDDTEGAPVPKPMSVQNREEETGMVAPDPEAATDSPEANAAGAIAPDAGTSAAQTRTAVAILTEPLKKAPAKVPVIFKAPNGTTIVAGREKFIPTRTYRLDPGVMTVKFKCPGRRGASGNKAFTVDEGASRTLSFAIPCKKR